MAELTVTTGEATDIETTTATLNGTVDDFGPVENSLDVWFKYSDDYNDTDDELIDPLETTKKTLLVDEETEPISISHAIDSLDPDTTYYFRIVGEGA